MHIPLSQSSALVASLLIFSSVIYYLRVDGVEYAEFKSQTSTNSRQAFYRKWTLRSFFLYACGTIVMLALFGRLNSLVAMPQEFLQLSSQLRDIFSAENEVLTPNFIQLLAVVFIVSSIVTPSVIAYLSRGNTETILVGDVLPLLPRNRPERIWAFIISVNAGISEELCFRLLLPLLLTYVFGNAVVAFVVAAALFGLIHCYQGWVGVVATTLFGVLLSLVYLGTGSIWILVAVHAAIDLNGLLLQPFLRSWVK